MAWHGSPPDNSPKSYESMQQNRSAHLSWSTIGQHETTLSASGMTNNHHPAMTQRRRCLASGVLGGLLNPLPPLPGLMLTPPAPKPPTLLPLLPDVSYDDCSPALDRRCCGIVDDVDVADIASKTPTNIVTSSSYSSLPGQGKKKHAEPKQLQQQP